MSSSHRDDRPHSWFDSPGHLNLLHRIAGIGFGLGLWLFGTLGLLNRLDMFSTSGVMVLGLSSNGLLSLVSLVVGGILIAAAIRGGRTASTVLVVVGAAFLASGLANVLVLDTSLNVLAFGISNVVFSLISGGLLLVLGAYGRFTGRLPTDNPYQRERNPDDSERDVLPTIYADAADVTAVGELADAERAVARGGATPAQAAGVQAAGPARRAEDRVSAWRTGGRPATPSRAPERPPATCRRQDREGW